MSKKFLILLSVLLLAFAACKKQQPAETAENQTAVANESVSDNTTSTDNTSAKTTTVEQQEVVVPEVNPLITVNVLEKEKDTAYTTGEKAQFMAGDHMKQFGITCTACHGESGLLDDAESMVNAYCVSCHGDLAKVSQDYTKDLEIDPHSSHLGTINCTACHGGHEPSSMYCNNCHSFDNQISFAGNKPLPKKLDIASFTNAKSDIVEETDVLVIGAGGSGFISALTAQEKGANVILVEKMPITGGNSQLAAGGMNAAGTTYQKAAGIQDDAETMFQDTMKGGKNLSNPDLVHVLANNSADSMAWLTSIGAKLSAVNFGGGATNKRFHAPEGGAAVGSYLVNVYKDNAVKSKLDVRVNSPAVKLLVSDNGSVYGAVIDGKHKGMYEIHAKAVILTSGGFSANADRVVSYKPDYKGMTTSNQPGATGDGLDLAKEANAAFVDMEQIQIHPSIAVGSSTLITEAVRGVGAIMINHEGNRFFDELSTRDKVSAAILAQKGQTAYLILDDNIRKDLKQIEGYFHLNLAKSAETLDELAKIINVPAENLKATVEEYNKAVDSKQDKYGKKADTLEKKLTKGPYVAIEIAPGIHYTMGGVKINTNAQVIDNNGKVIPNFYAAGEVTGGVHGGNRLGGNSISETVTFGRIAGAQAAAQALAGK